MHAHLKVRQLLDPKSQPENEKQLQEMLKLESIDLEEAIEGLLLLDQWGSSTEVRKMYVDTAGKRWNEASVFPPAATS